MDTINNMNDNGSENTANLLNVNKLDLASVEKMTTDELKKQLTQELHDADKYREATDLKEENIFLLIDTLKKSGKSVDTLFPE